MKEDIDKEYYSNKYFNGIKPKELSLIEYETPEHHNVSALICRKHNKQLGSLIIFKVDGEETEQYVQGMPKIHYLDGYHNLKKGDYYNNYSVYEKLDGTNICIYGLKDHNNKLIEVVPKTRNMGSLDIDFYKLYENVDTKIYEDYIRNINNDYIFYFELYGMGNLHTIKHMQTWLDIKYLGGYDGENFIKYKQFPFFKINRPKELFKIYHIDDEEYEWFVDSNGLSTYYYGYVENKRQKCKSIYDVIDFMKKMMKTVNDKYAEINGRYALEGAVINGLDENDDFLFIKVKPDPIEMLHKSANGIPKQYIMKEIMKYIDEHKSTAKDDWFNNQGDVLKYINENLLESFDLLYVENSQHKIKSLFEKQITPVYTDDEIIEIGEKLLKDYPDTDIKELMSLFGKQYPEMKKSSGKLYRYLIERGE